MGLLKAIWENIYDLLVEDGSIALGTVGSLVLVGIWSFLTGQREDLRDVGGWLLLVLLMALLVTNLYKAGRTAARKRIAD
jgi:hypothetical protein